MTDALDDALLEPLTEREREILQWVADGLSDREIGDRLYLSTGTVKWHIKNIYSKLGVHKRTAAIVRGRVLGLLRTEEDDLASRPLARKHNLPQQPTSLIGREADVTSVLALLADPSCRLLTLVGPGGIGKTRLAIHCAGQLLEMFHDGAIFVALESVVSPDFLAPAIAEALQLRIYGQDDLRLQVINAMRRKKLLLVLDTFEHLLDEASYMARMVAAAQGIKILVTSREILNLNEEWLYPIEGLAVPDIADESDVEAFGATKLFVERARRARNDFSATAERYWLIRICQMVGGMPLAIELLTPWLQVLTCREIAEELEHNRDLLAANRRDLPERHRSIRAVFEQSWALLTPDEQAVFMKIAVFRGGFTREAAGHVAAAALPTLASLVNKSLIAVAHDGRYVVHELSRRYAEDKLHDMSEAEANTRHLHSRYYADLLQATMHASQGGPGAVETARGDLDNALVGVLYAIQRRLVEEIAAYAEGLWLYFEDRGWYPAEAGLIDVFRDAIAVIVADEDSQRALEGENWALVRLNESLASLLHSAGQYAEARTAFEEAIKHSPLEDKLTIARLHRKIGNMYNAQRIYTALALSAFQAAEQALGSEPEDPQHRWRWEWIQMQLDVVWLHYSRAEVTAMTQRIEKVQPVIEQYGTAAQRSKLFSNRLLLEFRRHMFRDLPDETLHHARSALEAARQAGDLREVAWLEFNLGFAYLLRDEFDVAEQQFLAALELAERSGDSMGTQPTALAYLPLIYRRRQEVDVVERWAKKGLKSAMDANSDLYVAAGNAHIGWVLRRRGALSEAKHLCETALKKWSQLVAPYPFQWLAYVPLLAIALEAGDIAESVGYARTLLNPRYQQLIDALPDLLRDAVQAWDENQPEVALIALRAFCDQAAPLGYL